MRGVQQICLLSRNSGYPIGSIPNGRRAVSSRRRAQQTYDASKLVLDLDAADCKYVLRYEDWQKERVKRSTPATSGPKAQNDTSTQHKPKSVLDIYRPNPADYMRYALTQKAWKYDTTQNGFMQNLLVRCPPGISKFKDRIQWLQAYEAFPCELEKDLKSSNEQDYKNVKAAIQECKHIYGIQRVTALITRTVAGCKFFSSNGDFIIEAIRRCGHKKWSLPLKYVNGLVQKLELMGVDLDKELYRAGMYYAAKLLNYPALIKYIELLISANERMTTQQRDYSRQAFEVVMARMEDTRPPLTSGIYDNKDSVRHDLLRLLTGWETSGVPGVGEIRKPCFALLIHSVKIYGEYLKALVKLGAEEALWHEFNHPEVTPISWSPIEEDGARMATRVNLFISVFLGVGDPLQALRVLYKEAQRTYDRGQLPIDGPREDKVRLRDIGLDQNQSALLRRALLFKYGKEDPEYALLQQDLQRLNLYTPQNFSVLKQILPILKVSTSKWTEAQEKLMVSLIFKLGQDTESLLGH